MPFAPVHDLEHTWGGRKKQDGAQVKKHHKMVRCPKGTTLSTVHIARFVMFSQYVQMGETF